MNNFQALVNDIYNEKAAKYSPEELEDEVLESELYGEAIREAQRQYEE